MEVIIIQESIRQIKELGGLENLDGYNICRERNYFGADFSLL